MLNYFLTIVREGSINKAAEVLHITQPTLSRQIAALEEELGVKLFDRSRRSLSLTEEGILFRRRAEEILSLVHRTESEMALHDTLVEGTVSIGCGEVAAMDDLAEFMDSFREQYPKVKFDILTASADAVKEQMDRGLLDIGVLLEPVEIDKYDYVRLKTKETWCVIMGADDPLAGKESIQPKDLKGYPLIMPRRSEVRNEVENWLGDSYDSKDILYTSNLRMNSAVLVHRNLARAIVTEGLPELWNPKEIASIPLEPPLTANSVVAWRKHQPYSQAVTKFIEHVKNKE